VIWELYRGNGEFRLISSEKEAPARVGVLDALIDCKDGDAAEAIAKQHMATQRIREPHEMPMLYRPTGEPFDMGCAKVFERKKNKEGA